MRFAVVCSLLFSLCWVLSSCGFTPVYGDAESNSSLPLLQAIDVQGDQGRYNELLQAEVVDALNPSRGYSAKEYRLRVSLQTNATPVVTEADGTASRIRLDLRSPYTLTRIVDGKIIKQGSIARKQTYNISENADFASYVTQRDAIERGIEALAMDYQHRMASIFAGLGS